MPVVCRKEFSRSVVLLWEITESEKELEKLVSAEDLVSASRFSSQPRRLEHLASRAALRELISGSVSYTTSGQPFLAGEFICKNIILTGDAGAAPFISVSHTRGFAAVMVSSVKCALDMENVTRDFSATRSRFLSDRENLLPFSGDQMFLPAIWCSKEVLYKYSGLNGLDFKDDISISRLDLEECAIEGSVAVEPVRMSFFIHDDCIVVHTV